jgi:hypothetical protein
MEDANTTNQAQIISSNQPNIQEVEEYSVTETDEEEKQDLFFSQLKVEECGPKIGITKGR